MTMATMPRGVWRAGFRLGGKEILMAVDSRADCIGIIPLDERVDEAEAKRQLEDALAQRDPTPPPRLLLTG